MVKPAALTTLGKIGAAYGIKGWVRLFSYTDPPENLLGIRHFYLGPAETPGNRSAGTETEQVEIDDCKPQGRHFVGHIRGCDDRDQARHYTGRELQVTTASLPDLAENSYYWYQLQGLQVVNLQNEVLGRVDHLLETGANDVLVIKPTEASIDDEERLIPWLQDQVVRKVDLAAGLLQVDWARDY